MTNSESSLERLYPANSGLGTIAGNDTYKLHIERYHYSGNHSRPGKLADIACGAGYGSHLLATEYGEKIEKLVAVDNDADAIGYARQNYSHPKIEFQAVDALLFRSEFLFDSIISLETIEHLDEPAKFVSHMASLLRPGGRFIASAPVTPSMDANPYHKHDFTPSTFRRLFLANGMKEVHSFSQVQRYRPLALINRKSGREKHIRKNILRYYFRHPSKFVLRLSSLLKDGFTNKYLITVFEKQ